MTRLHVLMLFVPLLAEACANSVASPVPPDDRLRYATCGMGGTAGDEASLEIHERAEAAFGAADVDFEQERLDSAAKGFREAALILLEGRGLKSADTFDRDRRVAYANMVISRLDADDVATAREELKTLAEQDPDLAEDLRWVASQLPSPPPCGLSPR